MNILKWVQDFSDPRAWQLRKFALNCLTALKVEKGNNFQLSRWFKTTEGDMVHVQSIGIRDIITLYPIALNKLEKKVAQPKLYIFLWYGIDYYATFELAPELPDAFVTIGEDEIVLLAFDGSVVGSTAQQDYDFKYGAVLLEAGNPNSPVAERYYGTHKDAPKCLFGLQVNWEPVEAADFTDDETQFLLLLRDPAEWTATYKIASSRHICIADPDREGKVIKNLRAEDALGTSVWKIKYEYEGELTYTSDQLAGVGRVYAALNKEKVWYRASASSVTDIDSSQSSLTGVALYYNQNLVASYPPCTIYEYVSSDSTVGPGELSNMHLIITGKRILFGDTIIAQEGSEIGYYNILWEAVDLGTTDYGELSICDNAPTVPTTTTWTYYETPSKQGMHVGYNYIERTLTYVPMDYDNDPETATVDDTFIAYHVLEGSGLNEAIGESIYNYLSQSFLVNDWQRSGGQDRRFIVFIKNGLFSPTELELGRLVKNGATGYNSRGYAQIQRIEVLEEMSATTGEETVYGYVGYNDIGDWVQEVNETYSTIKCEGTKIGQFTCKVTPLYIIYSYNIYTFIGSETDSTNFFNWMDYDVTRWRWDSRELRCIVRASNEIYSRSFTEQTYKSMDLALASAIGLINYK